MAIGGTLGMGLAFILKDDFSASARRISSSFDTLDRKAERASRNLSNSMGAITSGAFAAGASIAGLLLPFGLAISKSAQFEQQMSDVQAKAQASGQQLVMLRDQALELSSAQETANFTAKQVGEAQSFLAMAGFNTTQIMEAMRPTLLLAAAGSLELGEAADIASNTLSQFGMRANEMARASDVIANAAVNSNQSVRQFAEGMKYFGPTAKALGVELEEAAGAMMLLANAGLQGSLGTRALGTALASRLTKPTKQAQEVMNQLGFEAFDAKGNFVGLENLIRRLDKSLEGTTPKMRQMAIATIFGGESIQEINTLLSQEIEVIQNGQKVILKGADALAYFTKQNENAAGVAARIARTKLDNLAGDFTVLLSTIETILIKIGAALTPILRPAVSAISALASVFSSLLDTEIGKWMAIAAAGLALVASGAIALNFAITTLAGQFMIMAKSAIVALTPLLPYIAIVGAVVGVFVLLNKAMSEFSSLMDGGRKAEGFALFLQRLGGIASGLVEIFRTWNGETFQMSKEMRDAMEKIGILDFFLKLSTWVVRAIELFKGIGSTVSQVFSRVGALLSTVFDRLSETLSILGFDIDKSFGSLEKWHSAGQELGHFIAGALIGLIILLTIKMGALAISVIAATWPVLAIIAAIGLLVYAFANWGKITDWFSKKWDTFMEYLGNKWQSLKDSIMEVGEDFKQLGKIMMDNVTSGVESAMARLKSAGSGVLKTLLGDTLGKKISVALGLEGEAEGGSASRPEQTTTPFLMDRASGVLASQRGGQAEPRYVVTENRIERTKSVNVTLEMDKETIASKIFGEQELQLSRE